MTCQDNKVIQKCGQALQSYKNMDLKYSLSLWKIRVKSTMYKQGLQ